MIYYKPVHFEIKELVSPDVYAMFGQKALMFLNPKILYTGDRIRQRYQKPVIVNNWSMGGVLQERGFRSPSSETGAEFSDHKRGDAIDFNVAGISPEEVRVDILANPMCEDFKYITCIEMMINWNHISCRNRDKANLNIELIYPTVKKK